MSAPEARYFAGGRVLVDDTLIDTSVLVEDGLIVALGCERPARAREVNLAGALLLPGMIDVHGDAFERQISPRPGVLFPLDLAMAETDRQLKSNGITTAYHGLTLSWEPGLRSVANGAAFLDAFASLREDFAVDHRVQLRWETYAFEALDLVETWLSHPLGPSLAFNDHTTGTMQKFRDGSAHRKAGEWAMRAGLDVAGYHAMVVSLSDRRPDVPDAIDRLARRARQLGVAMLSHDDAGTDDRRRYRALGADVAEFPLVADAAADARANGEHVVLGAPNVVRGGSHTGALAATTAIADGLCTVLASDYYYPAMFRGAELMAQTIGLPAAWRLVSTNPADAMGLDDRGCIGIGKRADLLTVTQREGRLLLVETHGADEAAAA